MERLTRRDAEAEATTDEEGEYEALLWSPGEYFVKIETPEGTPAAVKRLWLESSEERVDFFLEEDNVSGIVLDEHDKPVAGAAVMLSWTRSLSRLARTDAKGSFSFPLMEEGQGTPTGLPGGLSGAAAG